MNLFAYMYMTENCLFPVGKLMETGTDFKLQQYRVLYTSTGNF